MRGIAIYESFLSPHFFFPWGAFVRFVIIRFGGIYVAAPKPPRRLSGGLGAHNRERTFEAWTSAAAGFGVRKRDFRKVEVATGRGKPSVGPPPGTQSQTGVAGSARHCLQETQPPRCVTTALLSQACVRDKPVKCTICLVATIGSVVAWVLSLSLNECRFLWF